MSSEHVRIVMVGTYLHILNSLLDFPTYCKFLLHKYRMYLFQYLVWSEFEMSFSCDLLAACNYAKRCRYYLYLYSVNDV